MGLDCSHDAFHGAYSAFNRLRQEVCRAAGGEYNIESNPGLFEFLNHSDCDGEISPEMCKLVADELEELMPKFKESLPPDCWHIALQGGYIKVLSNFIAGCRAAYAAGEPLVFS